MDRLSQRIVEAKVEEKVQDFALTGISRTVGILKQAVEFSEGIMQDTSDVISHFDKMGLDVYADSEINVDNDVLLIQVELEVTSPDGVLPSIDFNSNDFNFHTT